MRDLGSFQFLVFSILHVKGKNKDTSLNNSNKEKY